MEKEENTRGSIGVSVILTTHDGRRDVCMRAIESVLKQTYQSFELIIVDDASQDGTEKAIGELKDVRIQYLRRSKCFGNDTRPKNRGIRASQGRYIAFLDSDNTWRPDHLQVLVKEIEEHPEVDFVYGDRWVVDDDGKRKPGLGVSQDFDPFLLLERNFIDTSDALVRREALFYVGGFDEEYDKYIDWNLWLRLSKAGYRAKRVPLVLTDYHLRSDAKSINKLTKREQEYVKQTQKFANIPDWDPNDCTIKLPYLGKIKVPRVAVFSLTYDRLEYTKECFASLYETAGYPFDHFVIDNGSRDGTVEWLEKMQSPDKIVFLNPNNKGISKASNQALDAIGDRYDIIVKVDNDCMFLSDGWLAKMVEIWEANHMLVMSPYVQGLRDNPGGAPRIAQGQIKDELVGLTEHIGGICCFASAKLYEGFRWDENDFLHGVQDLEFSQHARSRGYQPAYLENWYCEHYEGTEGQHERYPEYFERRKKEKQTRYEKVE